MTNVLDIIYACLSGVRYCAFSLVLVALASCSCGRDKGGVVVEVGVDARIKWKTSVGRAVYYSSPAISSDGDIYVGSGMAYDVNVSGTGLYAISHNGTVRWLFPTSGAVFTPAISSDGLIYVQDLTMTLYALDSTGHLRWSKALDQYSFGIGQVSPAITSDGTIYAGADGLYAFDSTGTQLWHCLGARGTTVIRSSPSVAPDGTIVVGVNNAGGMDAEVWKVNRDGTLAWSTTLLRSDGSTAEFTFSSPAIGPDGTIYIGSESSTGGDLSSVTALNPDGTTKWHYDVTGSRTIRSSPSIAADGTIYVCTKASTRSAQASEFLALNPDGTLRWSYTIGADIYCSPAIASNGTVYFGAETGLFYAFDQNGALLWTFNTGNGIVWTSPAIDADGTVYIGNNAGFLCALNSTAGALANSSWPKFRGNNRNSGQQ